MTVPAPWSEWLTPGDLGRFALTSNTVEVAADLSAWCYADEREQVAGWFEAVGTLLRSRCSDSAAGQDVAS